MYLKALCNKYEELIMYLILNLAIIIVIITLFLMHVYILYILTFRSLYNLIYIYINIHIPWCRLIISG